MGSGIFWRAAPASVLVGLGAWAAPTMAAVVAGFTLMPAPVAERGRLLPISGDAAYGHTYLHEDGWYVVTLPPGGRTDPTVDPESRTFDIHTTQGIQVCSAGAHPHPQTLSFEQLQARVPQVLETWERQIGPAMTVRERAVLDLKDDGQKHVRMAAWTGLDPQGRHLTLAVIEVPRGTLVLGCTGATPGQSRFLTQTAFRLAEGAL
jgi:hypothetical protein